jgi:hypothetical protein
MYVLKGISVVHVASTGKIQSGTCRDTKLQHRWSVLDFMPSFCFFWTIGSYGVLPDAVCKSTLTPQFLIDHDM